MSKHTPGPWEKGNNITCACESDSPNCWHQYNVQAEIYPPLGYSGPVAVVAQEEYDNASLIAAAPDLLTACEADLAYWKHCMTCDDCLSSNLCERGDDMRREAETLRCLALEKAYGIVPKTATSST